MTTTQKTLNLSTSHQNQHNFQQVNLLTRQQKIKVCQIKNARTEACRLKLMHILRRVLTWSCLVGLGFLLVVAWVWSDYRARWNRVTSEIAGLRDQGDTILVGLELLSDRFSGMFQTTVDDTYKFQIPKTIWLYYQNQSYINHLYYQNTKYYAHQSGYQLKIINSTNYNHYLLSDSRALIESIKQKMDIDRGLGLTRGELESMQILYRKIIMLSVLYENGGIASNCSCGFVGNLTWIEDIINNPYLNKGRRGVKAEFIGFHYPDYKLGKKKYNIYPFDGMEQSDKYILQIPKIQDYFLISTKRNRFLSDTLKKLSQILTNIPQYTRVSNSTLTPPPIPSSARIPNATPIQNFYVHLLTNTFQLVLINKQKQLDYLTGDGYKHFAFDYYGLKLINAYNGPEKLSLPYFMDQFFTVRSVDVVAKRLFYQLARTTREEFETYIGSFRFVLKLDYQQYMNRYLQDTAYGKYIKIFQNSTIQQLFYPGKQAQFIIKNLQKPFINQSNQEWSTLPKIIWVFWDKGIKNAPLMHQICFESLKSKATPAGFKVNQVNQTNVGQYIDQKTIQNIKDLFKVAIFENSTQTLSDLYRLLVIYNYGGVYLDITSIGIDTFDWVTNIGRFRSQFIFNRFGANPKILMIFNPINSQPQDWDYHQIDQQRNFKTQWHLGFQNSFIAAEKNNQFIKQWYDFMIQLIDSPYEDFKSLLRQNNITQQHSWTNDTYKYLFAMDTIKIVLGRRQNKLKSQNNNKWVNSAHYYQFWALNSYLAYTKLRVNMNYEPIVQNINSFLFFYPIQYVQSVIGKIRFNLKFFGYESKYIAEFLKNYQDENFMDFHSRSIFKLYCWQPHYHISKKIIGNSTILRLRTTQRKKND